MHRRHLLHASLRFILGLILFALLGVWGLRAVPVSAQEGGPQGAAHRGASIFQTNCVQCHGPQGKGDGPLANQAPNKIADFTDPAFVETRSPQDIFDVITKGRMSALMPPWNNKLSDAERWDAVAYVWSLHTSAADVASGEQRYGEACASCHGVDGAGTSQQPPITSLGDASYLAVNQADWRSGVTKAPHPAVAGLAAADVTLASDFARSFNLGFNLDKADVAGTGVVSVTVANGTTGVPVPDAPVSLLIFDGQQSVDQRQAKTDAKGQVKFEGLSTEPSWSFVVQTSYQDVPFESGMLQFEPSQATLAVPLPVYEGGAKAEDVRVTRAHWVIGVESPQSLDVGELYAFANASDRVYMGEPGEANGKPVVLSFLVPEGATNVSFEGGELGDRFQQVGAKYIDTLPLAPGSRQILMRYSLPIADGKVTLSHPIPYPIDNLNLLAPDLTGMTVDAPDWVEGDPLQTQGGAFRNYVRTGLAAGVAPIATLSGINAAALTDANPSPQGSQQVIDRNATPGISGLPIVPLVVAVVAGLLLGLGTYFVIRRQRVQAAARPAQLGQMRQSLVQEIADLDDAFDAGELTEADYQAQRGLLKARLVALMREEGR
jgi:mono/diheme cytochrome c family protein